MKNPVLLLLLTLLVSCSGSKDFDKEHRLLAPSLTSSTGAFNFTPMQNSDSNDVKDFKPVVYNYKNAPYSGEIVAYNASEKITLEGVLKNGIADGHWRFYYASGVVQIEGDYTNGIETGLWTSYYSKDKPRIIKYYDGEGYMLMRKEYFDTGKIKNYQNIKCPQFGDRERRIQFSYAGDIEYIDAEREIGALPPKELNELLQRDGLLVK